MMLGAGATCVDRKSYREQIGCVGDPRYSPDGRRVRRELIRSIPAGAFPLHAACASNSRLSPRELQHSFFFSAKTALLAKRHRRHDKQNSGETTS
ncbi:MAG: hypothetical protein V5B40_02060 [Candidatus Accumulibacter meliphilus]|jgi:hypothetical protein|uniref:hypothetical protein n=1 Tax=Candidatus Accumulibacter meliphilus TaxID=2211374 RepID=UPI002FC287F5